MAKCKFGAIVTDMRGKLGGHVIQGNGFSNTIRTGHSRTKYDMFTNKVINREVRTLDKAWFTTSQAQRNACIELASTLPILNNLGEQIFITGRQLWVRNLLAYRMSGQAATPGFSSANSFVNSDVILSVVINFAAETLTLTSVDNRSSEAFLLYARPVNLSSRKIDPRRLTYFVGVRSISSYQGLAYDFFRSTFPDYEPYQPVQIGWCQVNGWGFKTFVKTAYATFI